MNDDMKYCTIVLYTIHAIGGLPLEAILAPEKKKRKKIVCVCVKEIMLESRIQRPKKCKTILTE